jgi:hypothetical protein
MLGHLLGILAAPRATYRDVVARPRWIGVLVTVSLVAAIATSAFLATDVGRRALLEQQVQTLEAFGRRVTPTEYYQFQRFDRRAVLYGAVGQLVGLPATALVTAGLAFGVARMALRVRTTFRLVFAVVVCSTAILAARALVTMPVNYLRGSMSSPTNLWVLLPAFDDTSLPARVLAGLDLFIIWWLLNLAIGLSVAFNRRTTPIAAGILAAYFVMALTIASIGTALSGV